VAVKCNAVKPGKGGAFNQVELKNILDGRKHTEPVVKGQTAANSFKPATLTNGVRTNVPPFVGVGEKLVILTEDGSYVKRADK